MATSRPRPQVIRLTDAAAERIKHVMANAVGEIVGVRVGVKNGGCAGMTYTMEYADKVGPADEVVEDKGVRVLIDPKAILFLLGTEMDYKTEKLAAQFVFNNPNQTSACGCGESVQLKPAAEQRRRTGAMAPEEVRELFAAFGPVTVRRLFGGSGIYAGATMFALLHDGVIYLKVDAQTADAFERENLDPFTYGTKGGRRGVMSYRRMPDRLYDDPDELAQWARAALAAASEVRPKRSKLRATESSGRKKRSPRR